MVVRVTIFEDHSYLRESLAAIINLTEGFELTGSFENCSDVIEKIEKGKPDVVLMDIEMPPTNGIEGLKEIKRNFPDVNVVMLTVFDENEKIFEAICAGATGYLLKRTPPAKILEAIQDVQNGGAPMTPAIARKVLQLLPKSNKTNELEKLSVREQEILRLLIKGNSYKMVAAELNISIETVRSFIRKIYSKLQVHSLQEAATKVFPHNSF
jgi:DNA-binding NarL/FixJ family response regulator